jgi:probable FeS assembly SUF system protein SufT
MSSEDYIKLTRDCEAILIPNGIPVLLRKGDKVYITQALGNTFTVQINGNLARIEGKDADALGKEAVEVVQAKQQEIVGDGVAHIDDLWEALKQCYDPEIPVNIVDLGLIYDCKIVPIQPQGNRAEIQMTLTAPGCGMGPFIVEDVRAKALMVANITDITVALVWDPPWEQSRMSEDAKLALGML